jgi:hypothetical protein
LDHQLGSNRKLLEAVQCVNHHPHMQRKDRGLLDVRDVKPMHQLIGPLLYNGYMSFKRSALIYISEGHADERLKSVLEIIKAVPSRTVS